MITFWLRYHEMSTEADTHKVEIRPLDILSEEIKLNLIEMRF